MEPHRVMTLYFSILIHLSYLCGSPEAAILKSNSSESPAIYDQKQYGEYNVRLHLKDFQIVALLSEDALGTLSDDYEELDYQIPEEYLDIQLPTTQNASSSSEAPTTASPTEQQPVSTSTTLQPRRTVTSRVTAKKTESTTQITTKLPSPTTSTIIVTKVDTVENLPDQNEDEVDKIPVFVLQGKTNKNTSIDDNKRKIVSTSVTIVPSSVQSTNKDSKITLGEILQLKRCPDGYSRDKTGRCRRTRRPQLPFDISLLTSNLASKFKYSSSTEKSYS